MTETTVERILAEVNAYGYASEAIAAPNFAEATKVHDWRNYVPDVVQELWPHLNEDAKAVAYLMAEAQASGENWE